MKKSLFVGGCATLVIVIGAGSYNIFFKNKDNEQKNVTDVLATTKVTEDTLGLSFSYPSNLKNEDLSKQDIKDKFLFRLTSLDPALIVSIRYETGLKLVSSLAKLDIIDLLSGNLSKSLPQRFPSYTKISERELMISGKNAIEVVYTYKGPSGRTAKQKLILLEKDSDTAMHFSFQAEETMYDLIESKYFTPLIDSISVN